MSDPSRPDAMHGPVVDTLAGLWLGAETRIRSSSGNELVVRLPVVNLRVAVAMLVDRLDVRHLTTITCESLPPQLALKYHFWQKRGFTLEIELSGETPVVASIVDLIPGAALYEREVHGMFGVAFQGHPNLRSLLLPDDWTGPPPLRKERDSD